MAIHRIHIDLSLIEVTSGTYIVRSAREVPYGAKQTPQIFQQTISLFPEQSTLAYA
jgi:hypothetical protein